MAQWSPQGDKIKTRWAAEVNPANPLPEYPRPLMERAEWQNLNGLWHYAIRPVNAVNPQVNDGQILVPFAVESSLSGVMKTVGKDNELWYERTFSVPKSWRGRHTLLHFGAVDWRATVYLNGIKVAVHEGGYTAFTVDITPYLKSGEQTLQVRVWDSTNEGYQPCGKQRVKPEGIWYTPVTGIWQTVWMEPVNAKHVTDIVPVADIDHGRMTVSVNTEGTAGGDVVRVRLKDGQRTVAEGMARAGLDIDLNVADQHLWSPDDPFLYTLEADLLSGGKTVDHVKGYAAMRKISTARDANGICRLMLNNKALFQLGPLDQGYWPDGLYTAPTDEALAYDIVQTKAYGFNMIRKHMKVEPARWFYHCDRLGVLVWQDMPAGDFHERELVWQTRQYFNGNELVRSTESEADYRAEWSDIIRQHLANPCVVVWTPFNERWGQFKTPEITALTKQLDPTRLVNPASGGNFYHVGDMLDLHKYPVPEMFLYDAERPTVMGEFGGLGAAVDGHLWNPDHHWGYVSFKDSRELTDKYVSCMQELLTLAKTGLSAGVYTQTTDVEGECNGLMTYDRAVEKVDKQRASAIAHQLTHAFDPQP